MACAHLTRLDDEACVSCTTIGEESEVCEDEKCMGPGRSHGQNECWPRNVIETHNPLLICDECFEFDKHDFACSQGVAGKIEDTPLVDDDPDDYKGLAAQYVNPVPKKCPKCDTDYYWEDTHATFCDTIKAAMNNPVVVSPVESGGGATSGGGRVLGWKKPDPLGKCEKCGSDYYHKTSHDAWCGGARGERSIKHYPALSTEGIVIDTATDIPRAYAPHKPKVAWKPGTTITIFPYKPYKEHKHWAYDDPRCGRFQEGLVAGIPEIIEFLAESIPDFDKGVTCTFSAEPFEGHNGELDRVGGDGYSNAGNTYQLKGTPLKGWLCPALYDYFERAPDKLYVRISPLSSDVPAIAFLGRHPKIWGLAGLIAGVIGTIVGQILWSALFN